MNLVRSSLLIRGCWCNHDYIPMLRRQRAISSIFVEEKDLCCLKGHFAFQAGKETYIWKGVHLDRNRTYTIGFRGACVSDWVRAKLSVPMCEDGFTATYNNNFFFRYHLQTASYSSQLSQDGVNDFIDPLFLLTTSFLKLLLKEPSFIKKIDFS